MSFVILILFFLHLLEIYTDYGPVTSLGMYLDEQKLIPMSFSYPVTAYTFKKKTPCNLTHEALIDRRGPAALKSLNIRGPNPLH